MIPSILNKEQQEQLMYCSNIRRVLRHAIERLEHHDEHTAAKPLQRIEQALELLVIDARAEIYKERLQRILQHIDKEEVS